ncbi:MAG: hypothetical protein V3T08_01305 [Gemmatimonadota bacterium]
MAKGASAEKAVREIRGQVVTSSSVPLLPLPALALLALLLLGAALWLIRRRTFADTQARV